MYLTLNLIEKPELPKNPNISKIPNTSTTTS